MKHLYLFICLFLSLASASAQSVCENFDGCGSLTANEREHAFNLFGNGNSGCLADWEVVCGTPSIYGSFVAPYTGTDYALFGVHNSSTTESAVLKFDFTAGKTYTVAVALSNNNSNVPMAIDFVLLDGSIPYTYTTGVGNSPVPAIPASAQVVNTVSNFTSTNWQVVSFTVSNLTQNFDRFWIRQTAASSTFLFVDSLCITEQVSNSYCIDFDSCGTTTAQDREHAFDVFGNGNPGCLEDWEVTNGTPSIYSTFGPAYSGTYYALFGVHNSSTTESAALKYDFMAGHNYTVTMAIRNNNSNLPLNIDYYLLDAAIPYTYNTGVGSSATPAVPGSAQLVHNESNFTAATWQLITFNITNLSSNFSRFWIRQTASASNYLFVDDLCITENTSVGISNVKPAQRASLGQNYPNPFNQTSTITYTLPDMNSKGEVRVYDVTGKQVKAFTVSGTTGTIMLNKGELQPGMYFYSLYTAGSVADTKRMIVQ